MTGAATPTDRQELAALLRQATADRTQARIVGGGTSSRRGVPVPAPPLTIHTGALARVVAYEPADLTITVEAGAAAGDVGHVLGEHGQSWPQADFRPGATVGGLLSTAAGGVRRVRYGPIRDSVLEVVVCTGDGRLVTAGGRTVKGVAGYDLPRLVVGALGTLGVIVEVTLKLWPVPTASGWFGAEGTAAEMADLAERLRRDVHRPGAILRQPGRLRLELIGPPADVVAPEGMDPATPPSPAAWSATMEVGVPPTAVADLAAALEHEGLDYTAQVGVGIARVGITVPEQVGDVRAIAASLGGHAVVTDAPAGFRGDPWGPAPPGLEIMRRIRATFDPAGILNPGLFLGDVAASPPAHGVASGS